MSLSKLVKTCQIIEYYCLKLYSICSIVEYCKIEFLSNIQRTLITFTHYLSVQFSSVH